jgi:hypothetical protein
MQPAGQLQISDRVGVQCGLIKISEQVINKEPCIIIHKAHPASLGAQKQSNPNRFYPIPR